MDVPPVTHLPREIGGEGIHRPDGAPEPSAGRPASRAARRLGSAALFLLPGALTVVLAFSSGGYFPGATGLAALVVAAALALRIVLAERPFEGLGTGVAVAAGALALYAVWTLLSGLWSDSSARAMVEFDRALLYLLALVLYGTVARDADGLRWTLWGVAAAMTGVSVVGLITRVLPEVWPIAEEVQVERLSYPIGYWNGLGLIAAVGIVLCVHLASSAREPRVARVLGAAALPALGPTLLFTFSRGALAAGAVGVATYLIVGRPRLLPSALLAAGSASAVAVVTAYNADFLASREPTTPEAVAQGHDVAIVVAICVVGAALLRALLLPLDGWLERVRLPARARRWALPGAAAVAVAAVLIVGLGTDLPERLDAQTDRFTRSDLAQTEDRRQRLTNPGINRLDHWEVALDAFGDEPVRGHGAGTFGLLWESRRPSESNSNEAHSLYLEALAELGVVGLALLAIALVTVLVGLALRARRPFRAVHAAAFAAAVAWALVAAVDWDWDLPAVTLWLFPAAGLALAARPGRGLALRPRIATRVAAALMCLALAVTPALVAVSQERLSDGVEAYQRGDCDEAIDAAVSSIDAVGNRPEPYELLGYCESLGGLPRLSVQAMEEAVDRDPRNWEYRYSLALARAAAGLDPRVAAREALRLNPNEPRARTAVRRFRTDDPRRWRRAAREIGPRLLR